MQVSGSPDGSSGAFGKDDGDGRRRPGDGKLYGQRGEGRFDGECERERPTGDIYRI